MTYFDRIRIEVYNCRTLRLVCSFKDKGVLYDKPEANWQETTRA